MVQFKIFDLIIIIILQKSCINAESYQDSSYVLKAIVRVFHLVPSLHEFDNQLKMTRQPIENKL